MAFNFNWSPLLADTSRAREMLTSALNKSPKPPIIVDDIVVTELNLGTTPPELEILEIGDLAEDRFRGIFRMKYAGDAFLTLKTRVQANPLNTFLSDKPDFASPQPLAAGSGLTIPIAITLSEIKLSGFVILVFSKQKGITLVFRNDPLESLKVSSTFDSISFVRNYLQRQIEGQLRVLFMDDLPAIIHKLSLRMWSSEHQDAEAKSNSNRVEDPNSEQQAVDPLATPSQRPYDEFGHPLEDSELPDLSPETTQEPYLHFSTKNLLRLAALTDSNRTLSLFTPPIKDVVFRAWTGPGERAEFSGGIAPISSAILATLASSRHPSAKNSASSIAGASDTGMTTASAPSRPAYSTTSSVYGSTGGSAIGGAKAKLGKGRKRKNRVVDLRKKREHPVGEKDEPIGEARSTTPTSSAPSSQYASKSASAEDIDDELETPPQSPENSARLSQQETPSSIYSPVPSRGSSARKAHFGMMEKLSLEESSPSRLRLQRSQTELKSADADGTIRPHKASKSRRGAAPLQHSQSTYGTAAEKNTSASTSASPTHAMPTSGGILEQAWIKKMASETAHKAAEEKNHGQIARNFWTTSDPGDTDPPPPAYAA